MTRVIRKQINMIVEAAHLRQAEALIAECGVRGFTVIDGREGRGLSGDWARDDGVSATEKRIIVMIANEQAADALFERAAKFFQRYPGIIYGRDVEVVRGERF